jgi:trans-2-enoyl-CoA reductase
MSPLLKKNKKSEIFQIKLFLKLEIIFKMMKNKFKKENTLLKITRCYLQHNKTEIRTF